MDRRILGGTGISVSQFALGAMMFGAWGNTDQDECARIIRRALEGGINFVDTADIYSSGESEVIVGRALKSVNRDDVVLATKVRSPMGLDATDHIDLYQIHRPDPTTDIDETLAVLTDLVRAGKVRAVGCSTFPAEQIVEAQWVSERRGHVRFRSEQPPYSILARGVEASVLPTAQRYGMGVLTWGPLSAGWLSGRYTQGVDPTAGGRAVLEQQKFDLTTPENARKLEAVGQLAKVAEQAGLVLPHLALGFVLAHPAVTSVIIGPRTMDQLESLLAGADTVLDDDVLDQIDGIVPPGTDLNPADNYYLPPALADKTLRRR
jgi:aryl-alcohol dehydrogenase-like predicted oxidoreductase